MSIRTVEGVAAVLDLLALAMQVTQNSSANILGFKREAVRLLQALCAVLESSRALQQALPL